jgi:hypothetical protein
MDQQIRRNDFHFEEKFSQKFSIGVAELSIGPVVSFSGRRIFHDAKLLFCNQNPSQLIAQQNVFGGGFGENSDSSAKPGQAGRKAPTHGADF